MVRTVQLRGWQCLKVRTNVLSRLLREFFGFGGFFFHRSSFGGPMADQRMVRRPRPIDRAFSPQRCPLSPETQADGP